MFKLSPKLAVWLPCLAIMLAALACSSEADNLADKISRKKAMADEGGLQVAQGSRTKQATESVAAESSEPQEFDIKLFSELLTTRSVPRFNENLAAIDANWDETFTPMLLESARFLQRPFQSQSIALLEAKTGKSFGNDFDGWWQWHWSRQLEHHPDYGMFKADLYRLMDERLSLIHISEPTRPY